MSARCAVVAAATGGVAMLAVACSSTGKSGEDRGGDADLHRLSRVVLRNLHARRPAGPGADPRVMPGGRDYKGTPLPDQRLDCRPIADLFAAFKLAQVRQCVQKIPAGMVLVYRIRYRAQPVLELAEARNTAGEPFEAPPACARESLATIPVPREIFFQSADEKGSLECYASRLLIDSDKILNTPWPLKRTDLNLEFPLPVAPDSDAKTSLLLQTWVLTPFFDSKTGRIDARIVPDALCKVCMGEDQLITSGQPIPPHWPEGGPDFNAESPVPPPPPLSPPAAPPRDAGTSRSNPSPDRLNSPQPGSESDAPPLPPGGAE